jgi:hypothetical protein
MVKRSKVGHCLADAWQNVIKSEYRAGHINSERSLQGHLFAELRHHMQGEPNRQILIEPRVDLEVEERKRIVRPDIVICNANEVICVVELKYAPRGKAATAKDMQSIGAIAADQTIEISVERYLGPHLPKKRYRISSTTLFAWAGVHKGTGQQSDVWTADDRFANHYFLELHALTKADAEPRLVCNTNAFRRPIGYEAP